MAIKKSDLYSSIWASCDELRGGISEPKALYHGVLLTRAGALLAADWERLDVADRIEIEEQIRERVRDKVRDNRKPSPPKGKTPD